MACLHSGIVVEGIKNKFVEEFVPNFSPVVVKPVFTFEAAVLFCTQVATVELVITTALVDKSVAVALLLDVKSSVANLCEAALGDKLFGSPLEEEFAVESKTIEGKGRLAVAFTSVFN